MARLIESSLWVDFTRSKSPLALKTLIQPWILDPLWAAIWKSDKSGDMNIGSW